MMRATFILVFILYLSGCLGSATVTTSVSGQITRSATLSWPTSSGIITGYKIEQSTNDQTFTQILSVGATNSATVSGLAVGSTYYFRVRAYNAGGNSPYSPITPFTVPSPSPTPAP